MGTYPWTIILSTVVLLLDRTFADILVQPGYGQPVSSSNTGVQGKTLKSQGTGNPQQNYVQQQNPIQILQAQHSLQKQYLDQRHQHEKTQLLQLQHEQLKNPTMQQMYSIPVEEIVGTTWGMPGYGPFQHGPIGGFHGGRLFSLGPLGVKSLTLGGLRGGLFPILGNPYQQQQIVQESTRSSKSTDLPTQPRTKRDVRDSGKFSERTARQKSTQSNGMATNSPVKSKIDNTPHKIQSSKSNADVITGTRKNGEEVVGGSLLDPLGLVEKTEDLIDDLKSGQLPNPLNSLNNRGLLPNWLNRGNPGGTHDGSGYPKFEEHVVSQSQQYRYPTQGNSNNGYTMANQQTMQPQQSPETPIVGDVRQMYPFSPFRQSSGSYNTPYPYGSNLPIYSTNEQPWFRESNPTGYQGSWMANQRNQMTDANFPIPQQYGQQRNPNDPMISQGSPNLKTQKFSGQDPSLAKAREAATSDQLSQINLMDKDPIITAQNPSLQAWKQNSWSNPTGYDQIINAMTPMNGGYQTPLLGTLYDPITGSSGPAAWTGGSGPIISNPLMNNLYNPNRQMSYYDGSSRYRHPTFDVDDFYDNGYNYHHGGGGFNRIYESFIDDIPFGFGSGYPPHHVHNHHGYML